MAIIKSIKKVISKVIGKKPEPIPSGGQSIAPPPASSLDPTKGYDTPEGTVITNLPTRPYGGGGNGGSSGTGLSPSEVGGNQLTLSTGEALRQDILVKEDNKKILSKKQKFEASKEMLRPILPPRTSGVTQEDLDELRRRGINVFDRKVLKKISKVEEDFQSRKEKLVKEKLPPRTSGVTQEDLDELRRRGINVFDRILKSERVENLLKKIKRTKDKINEKIRQPLTQNIDFWREQQRLIENEPELFSNETKALVNRRINEIDNFVEGKGLTPLELEIIEDSFGTSLKLGTSLALAPRTTILGLGVAEQPELEGQILEGGRIISFAGNKVSNVGDFYGDLGFESTNVGDVIDIIGKGVQGSSTLLPKTSGDILTLALFEKGLKSAYVPKLVKASGLVGIGSYEGYRGFTEPDLLPEERYGKFLISGLSIAGSIPESVSLSRKIRFRLSPKEKTSVEEFGIEKTDIDLGKTNVNIEKGTLETVEDPLRLEYVPSQKEIFTSKIDPLKELSREINFKEEFSLPRTNEIQQQILDVVKGREEIITGSFAQKVLIKGSREFKDLDILSKDPKILSELIKERLGDKVRIEKKLIMDSPSGEFEIYRVYDNKGNQIADLDPIEFAEEGYANLFNPIKVKGYNLLPPEVRLTSKVIQQSRPLPKEKRVKIALDISQLTGKTELEKSPSLLRGYGIKKAEQKAMFDEKELLLTHGGQGIIPLFSNEIVLREGDFFSTPSLKEEGIAFARKSRMGLGKESEYANILDLLNPSEWEKLKLFPSAKNVIIEKAKLEKGKFEIPDISSTEIEAVRKVPKEGTILQIEKRFKTFVEGEPVEIAYVKEVPNKIREEKIIGASKKEENNLKEFLDEKIISRRSKEKVIRTPQIEKFDSEILKDRRKIDTRSEIRVADFDLPRSGNRIINRDIPRTPQRKDREDIPREVLRDVPRVPSRDTPRNPPRVPRREPSKSPPEKTPIKIGLPSNKSTEVEEVKESYDVYIKEPKTKRLVKVTKKPVALNEAKDTRAYFLDTTTSRTGKIKKRKSNPSPLQYDIPRGYGESNKNKFRSYKVRKGKAIPLGNTIIEKDNYLIDTYGEKKQLNIFKAMARKEKKKQNKKSNKPVGLDYA